ncbi:MAG: hypothetical protein EI684_07915 [Candidatus Viridilinea halotolerans]|uniref:DUF1788 domain-containing protein n=1 Tax=Candidatus Viridilinea halotolerans TaxID=2491704 RepID=A0A426U2R6_9CHLR|nr:MAG: hypothetical protein EI684_07915 [Candidatus Viridilinea halotolerans]
MEQLEQRLAFLRTRLQTAYESLGLSSGRPYLYFVYAPDEEPQVRRAVAEQFALIPSLHPLRIDLLEVTIAALQGEEQGREAVLVDPNPAVAGVAPSDIADLWQEELRMVMEERLEAVPTTARPLILLEGLAALHPLTNPTAVMEKFAEQSLEHPATGRPVPIVLFVPGYRVPNTSRQYSFLSHTATQLKMYRGEDV